MKRLFLLFFLALLCNVAFSQIADSLKYADSISNVGLSLFKLGDYNSALPYFEEAILIQKEKSGENNIDYTKTLNRLACTYESLGDYNKALKHFLQLMVIRKNLLGENDPKYAQTLNNIGVVYRAMGKYAQSIEYFIKTYNIYKASFGESDSKCALALDNIGRAYDAMTDYQKALHYYELALELREKILGVQHPDYATTLRNIAITYNNIGYYAKALEYSFKALEIQKNTIGEVHPEYAGTLDNICYTYLFLGNNQIALKYSLQALEIYKKAFGEENIDYAYSLLRISDIYFNICDYQNALKYTMKAMEIIKENYGVEYPDYATSLNSIGKAYSGMGDHKNALKYYIEALEIRKNIFKENHTYGIATLLNNIGCTYNDLEDYQNSIKYELQALENYKIVLGEEHPDYASTLNNIGVTYNDIGDYETALKYCMQALKIREKNFGDEHIDYAQSLHIISKIYFSMGDIQNAIKLNKTATDIFKNNLINNFSFMTSHEREAFWNANYLYFLYNLGYLSNSQNDTLATKTSYDTELITKGLLLASEISLTNTIMESGDTALISEYETMKTAHLQLNKELEKPIAERIYNCDSLENEIQKMERHIMEKSNEFGDVTQFIKIDWKEVQNSLKPNDVAIEFSGFTEDDTIKYLALVLTKGMEAPVCVPLFNNYELQKLQRGITPAKNETSTDEENRGATTVAAKRQGIYESKGLYDMLWKPLEKYFPENPRIFFAPSGMLHQIAVEYAPTGNGKTISDKYEIYRVSSTRFLAMDYMPKPFKNSVLYGGIYYDSDTTTMKQESDRYSTRSATSYTSFADFNRNEDRGSLNYLPGTKTEVEDIVGKLKKKRIKSQLYEGSQANEESFKALSGSDISVLHIATHGFFLPTDEKLSGDQSLIQSGLLLSGANYAWQNKPLPEGVEDGILTAKEISFMDLRKTDLVVLSACQTALGEITGEGVFGLQRGFKKAGARTIIMSLWPVDDNATLLMMTEFYTNLTKGMSKREAFLTAQNKVKTTVGFENPRYWAAFIMLDGNEK